MKDGLLVTEAEKPQISATLDLLFGLSKGLQGVSVRFHSSNGKPNRNLNAKRGEDYNLRFRL